MPKGTSSCWEIKVMFISGDHYLHKYQLKYFGRYPILSSWRSKRHHTLSTILASNTRRQSTENPHCYRQSTLPSSLSPSKHTLNFHFIYESWPDAAITTGARVAPLCEPTDSIALTTSIPSVTEPKTQCLPSSQAVLSVQRKNYE